MQPINQASLEPESHGIKHLRADQEFCGVLRGFCLRSPKPQGYPSLLGCESPYPQIVFRLDFSKAASMSNFRILLLAIARIPRVGVRNRTFEDLHLA